MLETGMNSETKNNEYDLKGVVGMNMSFPQILSAYQIGYSELKVKYNYDHEVFSFVQEAFKSIWEYQMKSLRMVVPTSLYQNSDYFIPSCNYQSCLRNNESSMREMPNRTVMTLEDEISYGEYDKINNVDDDSIVSPNTTSSEYSIENLRIGHTITLHTGHGGWPSEVELECLKDEIRKAGFHI
jgi:hypothetical protein